MKRGSAAGKNAVGNYLDKPGVSEEEIREIKEVFDLFATDGKS